MPARGPKWNTQKLQNLSDCWTFTLIYIRATQEYLLLALSGFLEEGRQRKPVKSSSKKKNLWYCRELERIFISSEPFWRKVKQSAATE